MKILPESAQTLPRIWWDLYQASDLTFTSKWSEFYQ